MKLSFHPNSEPQAIATLAWQNDAIDDVIIGGGAGGGKSTWECAMVTLDAMHWPDTRYFIGRKELKRLMQTTYITLTQEVFPRMGLVRDYHWRFDGKYNVVYLRHHGEYICKEGCKHHPKGGAQHAAAKWSTIDLLDLAYFPSDPLYDRFGSSPYTRGFIEEASEVEFRAYDILRTRTGRYRNKELGIKPKLGIGLNPSDGWPYRMFYDPWKKAGRPVDHTTPIVSMRGMLDGVEVARTFVFVPVLAKDNPDIGHSYRVNLATINDPVLKARLAEGDWEYSNAADVLFDAQGIADLFTSNVRERREKYMTVDSARMGGDKIVRKFWRGWECYKVKWDIKKKTNQTVETIRNDLKSEGIPREHCLIDDPGGGVVDQLEGTIQFVGASAPFGKVGEMEVKEQYENLRSQCVYYTAQMVRERKVAITEPDVQVREWFAEEVRQFKRRDAEKDGKLKITKKEDIKEALGRSPDFADTFWMRAYFDLREKEPKLNKKSGVAKVFMPDAPRGRRTRDVDIASVHIQD